MRAVYKTAQIGAVWRILRRSKADKNEMLRQQGAVCRARYARLSDPLMKVKGLLTDLSICLPM